jgi:murein DD-endopeptidase MepM/ murein hydrolase activator NlpD
MTKPTLRRGDKGAQVEELQNRLHSYGYLKNPISHGVKADGIMGLATLRAVMAFQARTGLSPDGICGPKTWAALESVGQNIMGNTFAWPFADNWAITSRQGWRRLGGQRQYHGGIDIGSPQMSAVLSPYKGKVAHMNRNHPTGGGLLIVSSESGWGYALCHLSHIHLDVGDPVQVGQMVALSGGTPGTKGAGYSTGPHLHISIQIWGQSIDPSGLLGA